ncbi:hypothetical protein PGT21_008240 [Puccinia graminis f. sp. tritici]|uniref:Uncharacterized protein n=1 Tax=Puccinia graminis f. sp. tritici TaxID=56615 RepID=A0A5B0NNF7_PUCGR|nr:hypothetical protein PGT21_008240 [Puccinia graminis f. sp. tritici]KAA1090086.1 hypothetical protein PGTUg99_035316 [Puccinia graminis f. sp. tritici]
MRDSQDGPHQYHSSRRHGSNSIYHQQESDRHYNDFAHARPNDQIGSPGSARRRSLLLTSPQAPISQSPSGSRPLRIQPEGSAHHRSYSRHDENSDVDLSSTFGNFGLTEQEELYNRQSHPFNSGEVDECDKYNPLVLHHARRQSIIQPHALSSWHNGHLSQSPRMSDDHRVRDDHATHEPPQRKQGLRYHQGLWQMTGKSGAVIPKATTSPASTTMSKTSAHAIISPSSSRSSSSSTVISPLSPGFSRDGRGFYESQSSGEAQEAQQGNSSNCRKSFPGESSMNSDLVARRRSCTVAAPPTLLNSIFQRVRNPQDCLPLGMRSPLSLTDEDLKTFGMSDSQLVKHQTKQDWSQGRADRSASVAGIPLSQPSSSSMVTGNSAPNGYRDGRRASNGTEEGYQARDRFSGRFIHQVTFSLDESHKSGLQAILVLRKLTNGLTSTIQKPASSPVHPSRSSPPNIPIPRISHRYPEHSTPTTVLVNGRPQTVLVQKIIPSVVIDWSDGARDQFDPTGMSLQEILDRCHFRPSSSS